MGFECVRAFVRSFVYGTKSLKNNLDGWMDGCMRCNNYNNTTTTTTTKKETKYTFFYMKDANIWCLNNVIIFLSERSCNN